MWTVVDDSQVKLDPICIIGAGPAGLITAHVLLQDGFRNVQVFSRDSSVGGVWATERIYPTMKLNNVHGQFRFSALPMPPPSNATATGGRLSGQDLSQYMQHFYEKFLGQGRERGRAALGNDSHHDFLESVVRFNTEVVTIRRGANSEGWSLLVKDTISQATETLYFSKIILCTGGCSLPKFSEGLSPTDALKAGFTGPVVHSSDSWARMESLVSPNAEISSAGGSPPKKTRTVVVMGGGKSAQDISAYLASKNVNVTIIYRKIDMFVAAPKPLPANIRQGRSMSLLWPTMVLKTRTEKFLHNTWLGSKITQWFWGRLTEKSFATYSIPKDSPLRLTHPIFWDCRTGDDGVQRDDSFPALVMQGKIKAVAPCHVTRFEASSPHPDGEDEKGGVVVLSNGQRIEASAVICATGYGSSWDGIFDEETALEIGLTQLVDEKELDRFSNSWDYYSLRNPPKPDSSSDDAGRSAGPIRASGLYKGIVPAKSIERRDIAVNGATYNANSGYAFEVYAHWISAYLLGEKLRLPKTIEDAREDTIRQLAWVRKRFPGSGTWKNPTHASVASHFSWPQTADDLLEDMYLPSMRSGGNWLTWALRPIKSDELQTLGDERRRKRGEIV